MSQEIKHLADKYDVMNLLGVSKRTVGKLMKEGCPYMVLGKSRIVRFDTEDVLTWVKANYYKNKVVKP